MSLPQLTLNSCQIPQTPPTSIAQPGAGRRISIAISISIGNLFLSPHRRCTLHSALCTPSGDHCWTIHLPSTASASSPSRPLPIHAFCWRFSIRPPTPALEPRDRTTFPLRIIPPKCRPDCRVRAASRRGRGTCSVQVCWIRSDARAINPRLVPSAETPTHSRPASPAPLAVKSHS